MARIAGVDLPKKKRLEYALTYIYGIGLHTSRKILDATGLDYNKRVFELTEEQVAMDIKALMDLGSYRGLRHRKGLPCRGQKTKTNARTRKGKKKTVGSVTR